MEKTLYSIRMHALLAGNHLSGAERLAVEEDLEFLAGCFVRRSLDHPKGKADSIHLTVEALEPAAVRTGCLPDLSTVVVKDYRQGREAACRLLVEAGVSAKAASAAMAALKQGAAPGGRSMRGAMLVDAASGVRLEPDRARGVRASRMDLDPQTERKLRKGLAFLGLDNIHVREALVLAAKVLATPGIIAELCWSDDPDYTAGYVATPAKGYVRFPHLKPYGETRGGRAFFVRSEGLELDAVIYHLERSILLIDQIGVLHGETVWKG
jgi:6-carboxyhexanoate--CoA ligase